MSQEDAEILRGSAVKWEVQQDKEKCERKVPEQNLVKTH